MTTSHSTTEDETILIGHMSLACYLWFTGEIIVEQSWEGGLCRWVFEDTQSLRATMSEYESGMARVDPRNYFPKVTEFKRFVYDSKPE